MRLVTVRIDGATRAGRVSGDEIVLLDAPDVRAVLEAGSVADGRLPVAEAGGSVALESADLAPLIPAPDKIVCVGSNYMDHILETGKQPPPYPIYFAKFRGALTGPRDPMCLPAPDVSVNADWEAELALIIGKPVRNITEGEALDAIAGCAVLNDLSVRDWQMRTTQFLAGKAFERSTPLGPALVTADEVGDGTGLDISCTVDGVVKQSSNTSQLVFGPAKLISDLSTIITLMPGDVIATGTPGGVGAARDPQEWLTPGAVVRTAIEGLGELVNTCIVD
ncbi:MAG: fumarylacetoacetate hydrolase family protein [Acidimicrobiaceae bacterium]|nr:fumarylacetoacetate hydrolase family protein [Acidimicrobiaceae bacterium]MXZ97526.1 fumarylacetoacetate hydrolase family protein [Acidimicrobiaceae bacterium]MYE74845.1 fumarylacetoacetate hydrolase family protein [Acidimicrobiaceae bacterium]MYE98492.1 fumarylacetoacetate hydrolase family protein [Acidimicrobiaceae bacterium]MYH44227.1 fumarylacetoacetate hydrolase family protein [Acidimicrobiaceae bacterium]